MERHPEYIEAIRQTIATYWRDGQGGPTNLNHIVGMYETGEATRADLQAVGGLSLELAVLGQAWGRTSGFIREAK